MNAVKLSEEHIAAVNRRRSTVVNQDAAPDYPPFITGGIELDQIIAYAFSFFGAGDHHIDSIFWSFGEGDSAIYPSKVLPTKDFPNFHR